jgi:hypothetical protein
MALMFCALTPKDQIKTVWECSLMGIRHTDHMASSIRRS